MGDKIVSDNSKCIRTSNFLCGGGMDVFWNDPLSASVLPLTSKIVWCKVLIPRALFLAKCEKFCAEMN